MCKAGNNSPASRLGDEAKDEEVKDEDEDEVEDNTVLPGVPPTG